MCVVKHNSAFFSFPQFSARLPTFFERESPSDSHRKARDSVRLGCVSANRFGDRFVGGPLDHTNRAARVVQIHGRIKQNPTVSPSYHTTHLPW